jgi:hypothetical protein
MPGNRSITDYVIPRSAAEAWQMTEMIMEKGWSGSDHSMVEDVFGDISRLFDGRFPGYRQSTTPYHDFEHTYSTLVASARLLHGALIDEVALGHREVVIGLVAALLHDVGLIQMEGDNEGTGAKHTIGHEERSIAFARAYLPSVGFDETMVRDCCHVIECTNLMQPIDAIPFDRPEIRVLGQVVGTADLFAQMADPHYLEKLLLLYREFVEGGIDFYTSEFHLLSNTIGFYQNVVAPRLKSTLGAAHEWLGGHFLETVGEDVDLYHQAIFANLTYLEEEVLPLGESGYLDKLRRGVGESWFHEHIANLNR